MNGGECLEINVVWRKNWKSNERWRGELRKDLNASNDTGFWKSLEPWLTAPKNNRKWGNSEVDIGRRAPGYQNTREWKHRMKFSWVWAELCFQVAVCVRHLSGLDLWWGVSEGLWSTEEPSPIQMVLRRGGNGHHLPPASQYHPHHCILLGLQNEVGFIEYGLEDKGDNECWFFRILPFWQKQKETKKTRLKCKTCHCLSWWHRHNRYF